VVVTIAALVIGGRTVFVATQAAILGIGALGLALVVARVGLISLGHGAFFGIGAYTSALMARDLGTPSVLGLAGGVGAAMAYGAFVGPLALRTRGLAFVMVTLAFGELARVALQQSVGLTGGDTGLSGIPRQPWAEDPRVGLVVTAAVLLATLEGARWLMATTFGRSIDAARQDESKASSLGYPVARWRTILFVISAGVTGLAGALFAHHTSFISPELLSWLTSGELLVMVLVGGALSLAGAVIGAIGLTFAEDLVTSRTDHWELVLGALLMLVVLSGWLRRGRP